MDLMTVVISFIEVVEPFISTFCFHILKTILYIAIPSVGIKQNE